MPQGLMMATTFGQRLKRLREAAELTQEQLARAAGLSTSFLSKLEQKAHDPSWTTVQALAKALGVSVEAFAEEPSEGATTDVEERKPKGKPKK